MVGRTAGADSLVLDLEAAIWEAVTSPDGQWLVLRTGGAASGRRDIVALQVGQDTVPRPLLTEPYDEAAPALSPDGRWLAYESGETGRREIFVRPFPDVQTGKWQVSTSGGTSPVWVSSESCSPSALRTVWAAITPSSEVKARVPN